MNNNVLKLRALITLFDISQADISKICNVSRPLITRLLANDPQVKAEGVFLKLEEHLPELISKKRKAYFSVEAVDTETVLKVLAQVKESEEKVA